MKRLFAPLFAVCLLVAACSDPVGPLVSKPGTQSQPVRLDSLSLTTHYTLKAENPCTGKIELYLIAATSFISRIAGTRDVVVKGTVKTTEGYFGNFEGQASFAADRQLIETGEFDVALEEGPSIVMTATFLYNDDVSPMIAVESANPVRCNVEGL